MDRAKDARKAALTHKSVLARLVPCLKKEHMLIIFLLTFFCPIAYIPTFKSEEFHTEKFEKNVNLQLDLLDDFRRALAGEPENPRHVD